MKIVEVKHFKMYGIMIRFVRHAVTTKLIYRCLSGAHLAIEEGRGCMFQKGPFRASGVEPRKVFEN